MQNQNYLTTLENDFVTVNGKLSKLTLESFLKKTDRVKHKITRFDSDSYLITIPMNLEDIGLESYSCASPVDYIAATAESEYW